MARPGRTIGTMAGGANRRRWCHRTGGSAAPAGPVEPNHDEKEPNHDEKEPGHGEKEPGHGEKEPGHGETASLLPRGSARIDPG